jgi:diguanylate cyclase (GGDEF)-like protein
MSTILVAGSAHFDMMGQSLYRDDVIDCMGDVSIEVGGTGCNIAINLAQAGVKVRFLTAMNDSAFSSVIAKALTNNGVETHVEIVKDLPTGGFLAHIDTRGEMVAAVSSTPVERVNFDEGTIAALLDEVTALVMDCNLGALAISRLTHFANDRDIPVYLAAVSEEKSLRIAAVSGKIKGIFLNRNEFDFFCIQALGKAMSACDAAKLIESVLLVTDGDRGSTLALPDGTVSHIPAPILQTKCSFLGMGDAMAAEIVRLHEITGLSLLDAALESTSLAASVGEIPHCHKGAAGALDNAIEQFQHHAEHDALTGVPNRRRIERDLLKGIARVVRGSSKAISVLMIDIDHFKSVNDTYGHNSGDQVIVAVAGAIQKCLREVDAVGRWGGEEFVVALPDTAIPEALMVAERIRSSIEASIVIPRQITVSVGCAEALPGAQVSMSELVGHADGALYRAKQDGLYRVCVAVEEQPGDVG